MSVLLRGICAAKGVAMGHLYVADRSQLEVTEYALAPQQVEAEVARLFAGVESARRQLQEVKRRIPTDTSADIASFIDTHLLMLQDSALTTVPAQIIRERACNAEWALKVQRDDLVRVFEAMDDGYLRTRKDDVEHVVARIQHALLGKSAGDPVAEEDALAGHVVLARDLSPAELVLLNHQGVVGIITEFGGPTSHSAILARSLRLPSVVGLHQAHTYLKDGDTVIVDGREGVVVVDADARITNYYQGLKESIYTHHKQRERLRDKPVVTRDGHAIRLHANIELPEDVVAVRQVNAAGVGLYRTEFLFMNRATPPDEEEQVEAYASVVLALDGAPVTIRTLDVGADKSCDSVRGGSESVCINPALGLRAVRLCLRETGVFLTQLRAILRAAALGEVRLMVPMVSTVAEVRQVRQLVEMAHQSLVQDGLEHAAAVPLGVMVEVPGTALAADLFAPHLDFLSIGTNDLIQYTLAIDRLDDEVNYLYDPLHPAVLRLVDIILQAGAAAGIPVSMCGEMAGNSSYTRLLLGLGLREFSVPPNALLEIKQAINESDVQDAAAIARAFLGVSDGDARRQLLGRLGIDA
ncbi:MAG: phosphoenolpyruvate--protein phosphotransferase [Gammaproteobacteria bacterium]|nr:phosphoenolpyruvate--protein phosphotransferase [Gammaproteobacteria bacterium]